MILEILSLKIHPFGHFFLKNSQKFTKFVILVAKISKIEENSKNNIYYLVPQIDHPVALCRGR